MDNLHDEDEYYEDYDENVEIDDVIERQAQQQPTSKQEQSKFRFPLIDDGPQAPVNIHEEQAPVRKKSAVFYDVEQDTGVKLPSHLPQQSLVYDVEVSNIAELLAKRNKSHGNRSIVRYEQSSLRPRSKGPITTAEKQFLTTNPQREDVVTPVVNREQTVMANRKRFVPTDVPSPVHGFNKPRPIEELLPDLEMKQQEMKRVSDERSNVDKELVQVIKAQEQPSVQSTSEQAFTEEAATVKADEREEQVEVTLTHAETQAEQLEQLVNELAVEESKAEPISEEFTSETESKESLTQVETPLDDSKDVTLQQQQTAQQEVHLTGEQSLQELAVQHLTIENSTVHIEQLCVEQPAPIVQPTINIDTSAAPISAGVKEATVQQEVNALVDEAPQTTENNGVPNEGPQNDGSVQPFEVANNEPTPSVKGSRIPFNVIMLDSDKKKLKKPLSEYGVAPAFPITDWKGNVITPQVQAEEQTKRNETADESNEESEHGGLLVLSNEQPIAKAVLEVQSSLPIGGASSKAVSESTVATLVKEENTFECFEPDESNKEPMELPTVEEMLEVEPGSVQLEEIKSEVMETEEQQHVETEEHSSFKQTEETKFDATTQEIIEEQPVKEEANAKQQVEVVLNAIQQQSEPVQLDQTTVTPTVEQTVVTTVEQELKVEPIERTQLYEAYEKPPMDFLLPAEERTEDWAWLDEQAEYLIAALASHQVQAEIAAIEQGPAVTQFEITVAQGTKVSKVRNLSDDIKLALAAKDIRIDAPIPGKRTIGIEIPNRVSRAVRLSEVTNSKGFIESDSPLEAALGLDLSGKPVTIDLRKMPHGLIAGATGSGKSVCINSILVSLLYKANPNDLKLMLIDPKMVELAPFNKIPHLVSPVITDVKAATAALKWAVEEMERRYQLFMHAGVRDLTRYNQQAENARQFAQKLPYILIVIDELADLMMMAPADVEEAICRIAQKARACGIHLIVATQRPSVDVITGLIKSNIPTRIAFAVSSAIDSRTILDTQGAERLLGRGDMLYLGNGMQAPIRMQGTFVTDEEIEDIIAYVRNQGEPDYLFAQEDLIKRTEMFEEQDELFEEVCRYVYEQGSASTSSVQRNFHIGYNRAARLIEMLEKKGFVSEARGSKPRDVFINESDLDELFK